MLWLLLYILIFGPPEAKPSLFDAKSKAYIKKYVLQDGSRNEALAILEEFDKESKSVESSKEKVWEKNFRTLIRNRRTSAEELELFTNEFQDFLMPFDQLKSSSGARIRSLIPSSEWNNIVNAAALHYDDKAKERQRSFNKGIRMAKKNGSKISRFIADNGRRDRAIELIETLLQEVSRYRQAVTRINYRDNEILRNKDSNKEDLEEIQQFVRNQQHLLIASYIKSHQELKQITTEDEWKKMVKIFEIEL